MIKRGFLLLALGAGLLAAPGQPALPRQAAASQPAAPTIRPPAASPDAASLAFSVNAAVVRPGQALTLTAHYSNIGIYTTYISVTPSGRLAFDPPVQFPCNWNQSPDRCTSFAMRGVSDGPVTISGWASGETYDEACGCFRWTTATAPPLTLVISSTPSLPPPSPRAYLPMALDDSDGIASRIVFTSNRDGNYEIYRMLADGTGVERLTNHPADDYNPDLSPDGTQIAWTSHRDGDYEIYLMNVDGTNQRRFTASPGIDDNPAWSPGNDEIAWTSHRDGNPEIYYQSIWTTAAIRLTTNPAEDVRPAWSPDSGSIAFESGRHGSGDPRFPESSIYLMRSDGANQRRLTDGEARWAAWSPDGSSIAYNAYDSGAGIVHVIPAAGGTPKALSSGVATDGKVAWSPDGSQLAFQSFINVNSAGIYLIDASGANQRQIVPPTSFNGGLSWR